MLPLESSKPHAGMTEQDDPFDRALFDLALALAAAHEVDEIRGTMARGLELLASAGDVAQCAICEISSAPDGAPVIAWQAGRQDFRIAEDEGFANWYARARRSIGYFESARSGKWTGMLSSAGGNSGWDVFAGLFVAGGEPAEIYRAGLSRLADLVAAALVRVERRKAESFHRRRLQAINEEALSWLELGADIVWEAADDGTIRCRRILNRRDDLARMFEGLNLRTLIAGEGERDLFSLLRAERSIRHLRVTIANVADDDGNLLYVSGLVREGDSGLSFVGTVTGVYARAGTSLAVEAEMLARMRVTRLREEELRIEAEAMLEGLRLLLAASPSREKLSRLAELLCEGVKGDAAMIVEIGFDGTPRLLAPHQRNLERSAAPAMELVAHDLADRAIRTYESDEPLAERLRDALGLPGDRIVALSLPLKSQSAYFFCALRGEKKPGATGLAFAERFALLLRQALLLREEQSQLAQTAKMAALGQMSASIAHELKQPLNTISLATQNLEALLSAQSFDPAAVEVKIARVMAQVERASNVIDRMRRFGRKSVGENAAVSVRELVEGVVSMVRHVLDGAGVDLEIDIAPDLKILADGLQIEQVLTNLIQNAADAMTGVGTASSARGGKIRIVSGYAADAPNEVVIRVEDSGPGFPPNVLERALEPFFTTKPAEKGTGLGLAICDAIARESGGHLTLGNHEGGGYVELSLPAAS